ncbi:MAG: hypothetical protein HC904_11430 [Blastochloris sp.]|nr:hypothetical protein [Blastochloris sp.]
MSSIKEIETAIEELPTDERWELFQRLHDRLWEDWDRQIEDDYKSGRLDKLLSGVDSDIAAGRVKPLNEVISHQ